MRTPREDGSADVGGVFRDAIVSRIGRRIVFDVEKARELADIVKVNNLPEGIAPAAMWSRMMTLQEKHREKLNRHRPMVNTSIRIEVSPAEEETVGWTLDDWRKLADDFVREVDGIELSDNSFFEHSDKNTAEISSNVDKESGLFLVE